jgi:hypothetical protein
VAQVLVVAAATGLAVPTVAHGTVTIGSNLGRAPNVQPGCDPSCTKVATSLSPAAIAPGGLTSPVNGTVVTWRIRVADTTAPAALRVIRRFADGFAAGAGTSATVTPPVNATTAFPTRLPIAIGESIGVNCCVGGAHIEVNGTGTTDTWLPALADGAPPRDTFLNSPPSPYELAVNADIEPTSTFSVIKVKSKKGGKVKATVDLPNAGTLAAGDKSAKLATAAAKKRVKYLKSASTQVSSAGQAVQLVKPTKAARGALADRGKLKAKLKLVFTPNGGTASIQIIKVKLKR